MLTLDRRATLALAFVGVSIPLCAAQKAPPKPLPIKLTAEFSNRFNWDVKKDNTIEDRSETVTNLTAQLKYLPNPMLQLVAGEWMIDGQVRPYNNYVNLAFNHINFRLGNQIVRWGKADEISPLDVVNPEDLTQGVARPRADRKIPVPMVNGELLSDYVSLQGIFIPFFEKSEFRYTGSDWAIFSHADKTAPTLNVVEEHRAQTLRDAAYGGRLSATLGRLDVAFVYLNHRRDTPSMMSFPFSVPFDPSRPSTVDDLVKLSTTAPTPIRFRYLREELYGGEFETTLGSFGLRGDVAYVSSHSFFTGTLQETRRPQGTGVLGIDYNGSNNSYVNVSVSRTQIYNYDSSLAPNDEVVHSLSGQCSMEMLSGNLKVGFLGFVNLNDKSFYQNPRVNLKFIPNVELESGLEIYGGPRSSAAGYYGNNDQTYLILKYYF